MTTWFVCPESVHTKDYPSEDIKTNAYAPLKQYNIHSPYMAMTGSSWSDIEKIRNSCLNIGAQYGIDARIILAMIMQESHGYVGAPTTWSWEGIPTAGLLQCWNCAGYPGQVNLSQVSIP